MLPMSQWRSRAVTEIIQPPSPHCLELLPSSNKLLCATSGYGRQSIPPAARSNRSGRSRGGGRCTRIEDIGGSGAEADQSGTSCARSSSIRFFSNAKGEVRPATMSAGESAFTTFPLPSNIPESQAESVIMS